MMHYQKGKNVETEMTKDELHFEDCLPNGQKDFLWMQVKGGTKVNNVISYAKNALDKGEHRNIVWTGAGGGLVKAVSCAEILKRTHPMYQVTRMCYTNIEEHWVPQMEGLDEIIVNRQIPCLHILMSLDKIDENVSGLQKPNTKSKFFDRPDAPIPSNRREYVRGRGGNNQQRNQNKSDEQRSSEYPRPEKSRNDRKGNKPKLKTQDNQKTEINTPTTSQQQEKQPKSPKFKKQTNQSQLCAESTKTKHEPMET